MRSIWIWDVHSEWLMRNILDHICWMRRTGPCCAVLWNVSWIYSRWRFVVVFLIVHFPCDKTTGLNRVSLFFEIINPQGFETMGFLFLSWNQRIPGEHLPSLFNVFFFLEHLKLTNPSRFVRRIVSASFLQNSFAGQHRGQHGGIRFISHQIWALSCEVTR